MTSVAHVQDTLAEVIDLAAYRAARRRPQDEPTPPAAPMALHIAEVAA